jgi:AcrR family transcriptional regulator
VRGETRDRIKKVALALFASDGYDATSMDKIATGVGIKKSSLYAFIKSKESLFWEIYEELEHEYLAYMQQLLVNSETMLPGARLFYLFKQYLLFYHTSATEEAAAARTFWIRVMFFPPAVLKDNLLARSLKYEQELGERYIGIIKDGIKQGTIKKENPEEILLSFYSLRQGLYSLMNVFMSDMPKEQKADKIDKVWDNYWQGIEKK